MAQAIDPRDLEQQFRALLELLNNRQVPYAVAGALAASIYREQPRNTNDIDIITESNEPNLEKIRSILESLNLDISILRQADLDGGPLFAIKNRLTPVCLLVGRNKDDEYAVGIDFLLNSIPWVDKALERAQGFDYGGVDAPVITAEDVILAKLTAVYNKANRLKDIDDIISIVESGRSLDWAYISNRMKELSLRVRSEHRRLLPKQLREASKNV